MSLRGVISVCRPNKLNLLLVVRVTVEFYKLDFSLAARNKLMRILKQLQSNAVQSFMTLIYLKLLFGSIL